MNESTICRTIKKVENVLIQSKQFHLPGRKALQPSDTIIEIILVDATKQPIKRPHLPRRAAPGEKRQRRYYSGKKKCHTQKAQLIANLETEEILATDFCCGSQHDFRLFNNSCSIISPSTCVLADSGYQGLTQFHPNSQTPVKTNKHHRLSKEQKATNRALSRKRILIENIIRRLKSFRILSKRNRNRRKRFGLRFKLIAAICHIELKNRSLTYLCKKFNEQIARIGFRVKVKKRKVEVSVLFITPPARWDESSTLVRQCL